MTVLVMAWDEKDETNKATIKTSLMDVFIDFAFLTGGLETPEGHP